MWVIKETVAKSPSCYGSAYFILVRVWGWGWSGRRIFTLPTFPHKRTKIFSPILAVEEAQQMYQLRKVALEAKRNKPDLNCHYTKIKVCP